MDLLTANDVSGTYPRSYYAATALPLASFPSLKGDVTADVCVIGAGFTGLSCALELARAGRRVVVLDASRVGFGASGRNGGQMASGQRVDQIALEARYGTRRARNLWDLAEAAKAHVKDLIASHAIDCHYRAGVAHVAEDADDAREAQDYVAHLAETYGYTEMVPLDAAACYALCPSPRYKGGLIDWGAAHLHPLRFVQGLAQAAVDAGAVIYENSRVDGLEGVRVGAGAVRRERPTVRTSAGTVRAEHVVLACNGYLGDLAPTVARRVMPINNYVAATAPLGDRAMEVLTQDVAIADSRFVVNYFKLSADRRLLFGGGESYGYRFPSDIPAFVRKHMVEIFPHLEDVPIDYAWGGTLAITMSRLPYLTRLSPYVLSASGFSGHGVSMGTFSGHLMARAILGDQDGFDAMSAIPSRAFPGGAAFRSPLLVLGMTWYALRDRLGF